MTEVYTLRILQRGEFLLTSNNSSSLECGLKMAVLSPTSIFGRIWPSDRFTITITGTGSVYHKHHPGPLVKHGGTLHRPLYGTSFCTKYGHWIVPCSLPPLFYSQRRGTDSATIAFRRSRPFLITTSRRSQSFLVATSRKRQPFPTTTSRSSQWVPTSALRGRPQSLALVI